MPDKRRAIPRATMSPEEREWRSHLARLAHGAGLLRGTLAVRERVCGKSNCRCAKGKKHVSLYLVASQGGRPRQLYVPKAWEERVRAWVRQYQEARDRLEKISARYWEKVQKRQD